MLNGELFTAIFDSTSSLDVSSFFICMLSGVLVGLIIALMYRVKTKFTKSFVITLAILPSSIAMVIMMVNGNIGAGVAVAGAFSLVRFRSVPGSAKEIGAVFIAMGAGLAIGMGYVILSFMFVIIVSLCNVALSLSNFCEQKQTARVLNVTIPEDLNYTTVFNDLFSKYTDKYTLISVKTKNMGSLFKLSYELELKSEKIEKELIDEIRIRNGNLDIVMNKQSAMAATEL